jgi:hypothetical protein
MGTAPARMARRPTGTSEERRDTTQFIKPVDANYSTWEVALASRYPLSLSEMRWPSEPLGTFRAHATARWGIECHAGWRGLIEKFLDELEAAIAAEPPDSRDEYRIVQIKEKFGRLTVYLASVGTPAMKSAIESAAEESTRTCEICGEPGLPAERGGWWAPGCDRREHWRPWNRMD